ncbi:MAG: response regulator [Alphaproteobacteria bacterium]|nr:MAG: response regulator [Alphaproteobacteria bacterium]
MSQPRVNFAKLRILVVENHKLMRRLLHEMLRGFGVQSIREARSVPEAIEAIYGQEYDLVILDFFLGDLDGAVFAHEVRHDENCINRLVPILLITGMPDHHKVLKVRDAGVNGMLAKPIAPKDLYQRIYSILAYPKPFVITPDYVGPMRERKNPPTYNRPSAGALARLPQHRRQERRRGRPDIHEDQLLL